VRRRPPPLNDLTAGRARRARTVCLSMVVRGSLTLTSGTRLSVGFLPGWLGYRRLDREVKSRSCWL
jgi:hypothetical protein